jgi:hypothetical protein
MSEKKYKKQAFKMFFDMGLNVKEAKITAYNTLITSRDLASFQNNNKITSEDIIASVKEATKIGCITALNNVGIVLYDV